MDVEADVLHDVAFAVIGLDFPNAQERFVGGGIIGVFVEWFGHGFVPYTCASPR